MNKEDQEAAMNAQHVESRHAEKKARVPFRMTKDDKDANSLAVRNPAPDASPPSMPTGAYRVVSRRDPQA
jgi:hypothetical protein